MKDPFKKIGWRYKRRNLSKVVINLVGDVQSYVGKEPKEVDIVFDDSRKVKPFNNKEFAGKFFPQHT